MTVLAFTKCERCGQPLRSPDDSVDAYISSGKCGACLGKYSRLPERRAS